MQRIDDFERLGQPPGKMKGQRKIALVMVKAIVESSEINERIAVAQIECPVTVGRQRRLLEREKQMAEAALARAVRAENNGQRRQPDLPRVLPGLEVPDTKGSQHSSPSEIDHAPRRAPVAGYSHSGKTGSRAGTAAQKSLRMPFISQSP